MTFVGEGNDLGSTELVRSVVQLQEIVSNHQVSTSCAGPGCYVTENIIAGMVTVPKPDHRWRTEQCMVSPSRHTT
jgi:hypothetical protein